MASDSSNTNRPQQHQHNSFQPSTRSVDVDGEATETFSFDVSAAEAADLKQKTDPHTQPESVIPTPRLDYSQSASDISHINPDRDDTAEQIPFIRVDRPAKKQQKNSSLVTSLLLHAALLLPFGFMSQNEPPAPFEDSLQVSFETEEPLEELDVVENLELETLDEIESVDVEINTDLPNPGLAGLAELNTETAFGEITDENATSSSVFGDLDSIFGSTGSGQSNLGIDLGGVPMADFFGTKVNGSRIVYVLDNSGGMVTGELETLITELLRSVESLNKKQYFYVIFYSDSLYPLFYPNAPQHFVQATDENKRLLKKWLDTIELCVGNVVDEALAAATTIRPDVVYLLTDGDLDSTRDQRRIRFLLNSNQRSFPIHTFGLGTGTTSEAASKLKRVAEANNGSFRAVEVDPDAKMLAKIKQRPYHNKSPGEIWGLRVGKR